MKRIATTIAVLWVSSALSMGCLSDPYTGSMVIVDFLSDLAPSALIRLPDGSTTHYEMWVAVGEEGVISLGKFKVTSDLHVMSYPALEARIGSVTGADDTRRSGVDFPTDVDLREVTWAFVTIEPDGETDIAPSDEVIMEGGVSRSGPSVLRGEMEGEYRTRLGETMLPVARVAIVLTQDEVVF